MSSPRSVQVQPVAPVACDARVWKRGDSLGVTVVVKACLALVQDAPARLLPPVDLVREDRYRAQGCLEAANDLAPYLPTAGVILVGSAHAPPGQRVTGASVRLGVFGDKPLLNKVLHVFGNRTVEAQSTPQPFDAMPIAWELAYGGPGVEDNPVGTGAVHGSRVPNIVDPAQPMRPAGFGPIAKHWGPRRRLLKGGVEPPPSDISPMFDWTFLHAAPADQQIERLTGSEWIVLDGLHPTFPQFRTKLPDIRAHARFHLVSGQARALDMRADTLVITPERQTCELVFRGIAMLEPRDIEQMQVIAGLELVGHPLHPSLVSAHLATSAPPAHPIVEDETVIEDDDAPRTRIGEALGEMGAPFALAQPGKRVPTVAPIPGAPWSAERGDVPPPAGLPFRPREPVESSPMSVTVDASSPPDTALPFARAGAVKPPAPVVVEPPKPEPARAEPPKPEPLKPEPVRVEPARVEPPRVEAPKVEPAPPPVAAPPPQAEAAPPPEEPKGIRATIARRMAAREPLTDLDLSGADLRDIDLGGAVLSRMNLKSVNLSGAKLADARLAGAELQEANLAGANLRGADLTSANLTRANLEGACLEKAILADATLVEVQGKGAILEAASLARARLSRASFEEARFAHADATQADFGEAKLAKASFTGATLIEARFDDVRAESADFSEARLSGGRAVGATLSNAKLDGLDAERTSWERATLEGASFARARLASSDLSRANATNANFAGADLKGCNLQRFVGDRANLSDATLPGVDLRSAQLVEANLERANLREVSGGRADLSRARLTEADLQGATLRGAKLGEASFVRANLEGADLRDADVEGANVFGASRKTTKLAGKPKGLLEIDPDAK